MIRHRTATPGVLESRHRRHHEQRRNEGRIAETVLQRVSTRAVDALQVIDRENHATTARTLARASDRPAQRLRRRKTPLLGRKVRFIDSGPTSLRTGSEDVGKPTTPLGGRPNPISLRTARVREESELRNQSP